MSEAPESPVRPHAKRLRDELLECSRIVGIILLTDDTEKQFYYTKDLENKFQKIDEYVTEMHRFLANQPKNSA